MPNPTHGTRPVKRRGTRRNLSSHDNRSVGDRILDLFQKSYFDSQPQDFVPEGEIDKQHLVTAEAVKKTLNIKQATKEDDALVAFILERAKKVFAIAVHSGLDGDVLYRAIKLFVPEGDNDPKFTDKDLPIEYIQERAPVSYDYEGDDDKKGDEDPESPTDESWDGTDSAGESDGSVDTSDTEDAFETHVLTSLDPSGQTWTRARIYRFYKDQWKFLVPVFSTAIPNYDLKSHSILPFTWKSKKDDDKDGAFGRVFKVKIHKDHYKDPERPTEKCPDYFAIKEIHPATNEEHKVVVRNWESEARALQAMNSLKQPNIVRFITAFRRGPKNEEDHYLMFEWADGGSLRDLWIKSSQPVGRELNAETVKQTLRQLLGLAIALCAAHNLNKTGSSFRHGDLKPENILWFKAGSTTGYGTLKIGDWGLAKHHNVATQYRTRKTSTRHGTLRYEPPEVITGLKHLPGQAGDRLSRLYDIWSMGCVTLEYIVWLLYGREGLDDFNLAVQGDPSYEAPCYQITEVAGEKTGRVHDVVVRWMGHMADDPACARGTALGDLLDIVRERLLVVPLPPRMGSFDVNDSENSSQLSRSTTQTTLRDSEEPTPSPGQSPSRPRVVPTIVPPINIIAPESREPSPEPPRPPEPMPGPYRALAKEFQDKLDEIVGRGETDESYWFAGTAGQPPRRGSQEAPRAPSSSNSNLLTEESARNMPTRDRPNNRPAPEPGMLAPQEQQTINYAHPKLDEDWEFQVDNAFAGSLFSRIKKSATLSLPSPRDSSNLCDDCQDLDFWSNAFNVVYEIPDLEKKAGDCELCNLFWETCKAWNGDKFPTVQFERVDSFLKMNGGGPPVLSIVRGPDLQTRVDIQIGFPELPPAGSPTHFEVIRQWLKLCDDKNKHPRCQSTSPGKSSATKRLPTRLIDVGNEGEATVRLVETKATEVGDYIALSHPWGDPPHFCTFKSNLPAHKSGIDIGELPATFRDAVLTTRALGVQYLWIDSLCIVQKSDDDDGDFDIESRRMESVFSSAYCVIAASRASNHTSGFLQPQRQRRYVALRRGSEEPFYICENLDDFKSHVLEGPMSQRGWVFQEHALARRTIFFTEHQTYWECGEGVRCETLTRMNNNLAAFLGDPNFPQIVMSAKRGEKIIRFQNLYKQYSRLDFSRDYDRPIAINGLEKRLLEAFGNEGGFGIIDEGDRDGRRTGLLRRSLLWHRWTGDEARPAGEATLSRIKFPRERAAVPSWSWMAYMGEIDYLPLDFNGVEWTEVRSPWSGSRSQRARTADRSGNIALTAVARDVDASAAGEGEGRLILDTPGGSEKHVFKAVVLARKGKNPREPTGPRRHYILVITPTNQLDRDGNKVYERVGVGYLPGRCLSADGPTVRIY